MLEDKVADLLQKYLGNYVRGLSKEALKISVWRGDVELTNMQLKPEALNALKLPVKVKSGFLGSIKLKVPWSRLGQEPVLVYLDRIFLLVEPATKVEGSTDDFVQEAKRSRVREMETKLLESKHKQEAEENTSWLGSLINTIIGNIKVSITNIHIRYEDTESNPGHPFAAGITLEKLASVTIDDNGNEIFITGGALEHMQKSIALERLAIYFDSDIKPWKTDKPWEELLPSQWSQIFEPGIKAKESENGNMGFQEHSYLLLPVRGYAKYTKLGYKDLRSADQPAQKALINLDDVTLSLSQEEYRDILKLAENITAFNRRLKYAHYRPLVGIHEDAKSWWKYACKVLTEEQKKASGHVSWEHVLQYARLRKRYVSRYVSCLQADPERTTIDDDKEIQKIDRELEAEVILQWRMLAHNFVKQTSGNDILRKRKPAPKGWSLFGWGAQSGEHNHESEAKSLSEEEWKQINQLIGYKEDMESSFFPSQGIQNMLHTLLEVHMQHNASKLTIDGHDVTELSCEGFQCSVKLYPETKIFDLQLQSYQLNSPEGLLLESATEDESLKATFSYMPFDRQVDWSLTAKASPCYMTYLKDTVNQITSFFESSSAVSQTVALETAAAVQMTLNQFRRSAQQQLSKALEDRSRFSLNMDIAAPKITIPTEFFPDGSRETKLLLDLGYFTLNTEGADGLENSEENEIYMHFKLGLKDISAFLVDGDYDWKGKSHHKSATKLVHTEISAHLPVLDECGITISLQQIRVPHPLYPPTRLAVRLPSLGFHFSPARYHRLMQVAKLFQNETSDPTRPWDPADFDGYLSVLSWKGVGNREAVWQYQYAALVGPFLYVLESPNASSYKHRISLGGKQAYNVPAESVGDVENVLAICDTGQFNSKVAEMVNALILRCDDDTSRRNWQSRLQGAIYRASASSAVTLPDEIPSSEDNVTHESLEDFKVVDPATREKVFFTGVLDELKVSFSSSLHGKQNLRNVLLSDEQCLLEFRALGSKVEFSMREHDMAIGAVLESLEIEDAFVGKGSPSCQFLVRSFIKNSNKASGTRKNSLGGVKQKKSRNSWGEKQFKGSDYFFETSEDLEDSSEHKFQGSRQPSDTASEFFDAASSLANEKLHDEIPSFRRIPGLLPNLEEREKSHVLEQPGYLDSFVKAQVILLDQDSPAYTNIDKQVLLSLATLSFYFNRPTILALLNFVNAINIEDTDKNIDEEQNDTLTTIIKQETDEKNIKEESNATIYRKDSIVKGLLGKGKDRVIFSLVLSMARAQFVLNNENETQLATLYQDNLHADIKVFPSTFGVKASLGNLKVSDNSLDGAHPYYWICDMRDPGGSSFVQLEFISFNSEDDDYQGYDYSLVGELSQVQVVYLNRFIQEIVAYFMGLIPKDSNNAVKLQDRVSNSEKWFTKSEIEGSPALRLDLSLSKPIIIMPRRTDSNDFLKLDVLHVTVQNTFEWLGGDNNEAGAIHLEIMSLMVQDVNLTVGVSGQPGESIIQDVSGLSLVIRRSLRDLWHQIPNIEAAIKIEELKATMSDKEYEIITECAMTNMSETPNNPPLLDNVVETSPGHEIEHENSELPHMASGESSSLESWVTIKVTVDINLVELSLYTGRSRDAPLATTQISGMWLLYKSTSDEESLIMVTLKNFSVTDDREGTEQEFRRAIGKADNIEYAPFHWVHTDSQNSAEEQNKTLLSGRDCNPVTTMLILDVKLNKSSQKVSFCIQRPQLLVALDFMLAVAEFFVPSIMNISSDDNVENPVDMSWVILDQPVYYQCHDEVTISPTRPLVVDDERYDSFIYDGKGGRLRLVDRHGADLAEPSQEALLFIGSGKNLQFKNVIIQNGEYLDSCISLGANSSYSASEDDGVFLLTETNHFSEDTLQESSCKDPSASDSQYKNSQLDLVIELQAVGPEFTFYNTSKDNEVSTIPSEKLLHAEVDIFSRLILKGDNIDLNAKALGLTVQASSGVRVVEPFDTNFKFSKVAGKTNIHVAISDMLTNFSYSILQLFIRLQEDILAFLSTTSRKATVVCSQFKRIWVDESISFNQKYAFWRPQAPPGFAVLGDCVTPVDEPPSKGVLALNTSFAKVKRPLHFELVWSSSDNYCSDREQIKMLESDIRETDVSQCSHDNADQSECRVWMPIPPEGYVALGCVVSRGREQPSLSSSLCVSAALVTPCPLKDCVFFSYPQLNFESKMHAFWRVDNSVGSFLPRQSETGHIKWKAYDFRYVVFGYNQECANPSMQKPAHGSNSIEEVMKLESPEPIVSSERYQNVAEFELVWWNRGNSAKRKVSIWRPILPPGCFYVGDIAVPGYEPPNMVRVLRDLIDGTVLRSPLDLKQVGHIDKRRGMDSVSFWFPQAPPGYVSLGCIASKSTMKPEETTLLRCVRSDLVSGGQFPDNSIWDTTEIKHTREGFSIWTLDNELGTFIVRNGFKRPPKRFGLRLADQRISGEPDDLVVDAEVGGLSATLFDDFGGLMAPLLNVSLTGITLSLHGRFDNLNSTLNLSLMARSYNEKDGSWEPLIEPVDGFIRYRYDKSGSGAPSQIRMASTRDLNMNFSVSNVNMLLEAFSSWNRLNEMKGSSKIKDSDLATVRKSVLDKETCYIVPQNKLGRDMFLRTVGFDGQPEVKILPPGDLITIKVPASNSICDTHLMGNMRRSQPKRVAVVISDAELPECEGSGALQYMVAVRVVPQQLMSGEVQPQVQSARTRCMKAEPDSPTGSVRVCWNEVFYFKVDAVETHVIEIVVTDVEKGIHIGSYSTLLTTAIFLDHKRSNVSAPKEELDLAWRQLCSTETINDESKSSIHQGKIRCGMFISSIFTDEMYANNHLFGTKGGVIQISPTREGPWTTVNLTSAASAVCWRMENDSIAREVSVKGSNKYVIIRSLVSVLNQTDFSIELCLFSESSNSQVENSNDHWQCDEQQISDNIAQDEVFENEKYHPLLGWGSSFPGHLSPSDPGRWSMRDDSSSQDFPEIQLPPNWEWASDWHIDNRSSSSPEGWTYAVDFRHLKWPAPFDPEGPMLFVRRRRWVRMRQHISKDGRHSFSVGILRAGDVTPLPAACLGRFGPKYILKFKPCSLNGVDEYLWSNVLNYRGRHDNTPKHENMPHISVSLLMETEELVYYSPAKNANKTTHRNGLWFCLSVKATEIGKDVHLDPIRDWKLVLTAPLTLINFLPVTSEFSVLEKLSGGELSVRYRGVVKSGETIQVYSADLRNPVYLSLIPQGGWQPIHEAALISHPTKDLAQYLTLKNSYSGRMVQVILEHNKDGKDTVAKILRIYTPYWLECVRCPPLQLRLVRMEPTRKLISSTTANNEKILEQINQEEMQAGCTVISTFDPKSMGLSIALSDSPSLCFSPATALSPLTDLDGSLDLKAHDGNGHSIRLFVSTKPCPYQSAPTKVICVHPYITFTNRTGQCLYIKMNSNDQPKPLHASDWRVAYCMVDTEEPEKLQVRLENTKWSYAFAIKEDTISVVVRKEDGTRQNVRAEIRGYEEGSRFLTVFRLGSSNGPFRIENRTNMKLIKHRQSGLNDDAWQLLKPLSTMNFAWEDPYGQHLLDVLVEHADTSSILTVDIDKVGDFYPRDGSVTTGIWIRVIEVHDIKVVRFFDDKRNPQEIYTSEETAQAGNDVEPVLQKQNRTQSSTTPLELILELGNVGVSIVDQRPKEILYLYLQRVFISYSIGYTSRLKLLLENLQLDNQLPLTSMPVLLSPEVPGDMQHPVFKLTFTMSNDNADGTQVYPYIGIQVTQNCWRVNVHEPIIWALMDYYKNIQLDKFSGSSNVTEADPEIRIDLIDISEMRLKFSLEAAPDQRPHGIFGIWTPIINTIGNVLKMQIHFRKVVCRNKFMRKSSVMSAITNRIRRDLIHNPFHLLFGVDVLGMTSSTLATLSKGFAELSTDGQFLQLRTKQGSTRRITGVGDGILQGTEALAQGVAFGVSGVLTKPWASAREHGIIGFIQGLGTACLGFVVQPVSGVLDFVSLTVHGIGASCTRFFEIFENKSTSNRIRLPRAIRGNGLLEVYDERAARGQMVLHLAEVSRHFGCTEIFKEPSKFAWSDSYEEHFDLPHRLILLITNRRVLMVQCSSSNKTLTKPCKIQWDVPWDELLALELVKGDQQKPSHVILHLRNFKKFECFVRVIKVLAENDQEGTSQATVIYSFIQRLWNTYQSRKNGCDFKMLSNQQQFASSSNGVSDRSSIADSVSVVGGQAEISSQCLDSSSIESFKKRPLLGLSSKCNEDGRFRVHTVNFQNIWSSEQDSRIRCTLCPELVGQDKQVCSIWRPICPDGYISVGHIAHAGKHSPTIAAVYQYNKRDFASPIGFDLVWRNCIDDFIRPLSIWVPKAPEGYRSIGCIAVAGYVEPEPSTIFCAHSTLVEDSMFEDEPIWTAPGAYPWACYLYQVQSEALHFVARRQRKEESRWRPCKVVEYRDPSV